MKPATKAMLQQVIRLMKGIIKAIEEWLEKM